MPARRKAFTATGIIVVLVAAAGLGLWYQFFRDDAPPPVSLGSAVEAIEGSSTATSDTESTSADSPASNAETSAGLDGVWAVAGSADSFVGYRIGEELASIGTTEAVGRTSSVEASVTIEGGALTVATLTADMTSLESDESRRDQALERQALETSAYPTATFELSEPIVLSDGLADGVAATVTATGTLTLHGVTKEVQIPLDVQLTDGTLIVVGSLDIALSDYEIASPQSPSVVSVNDSGVLELQLFLSPAA